MQEALRIVVMATRFEPRPIVMLTNDQDTSHVNAAVAAGVSASIVAGLSSKRTPYSGRRPRPLSA